MKFALLADIHSNIEALDACIDHARHHGAERFAFIGDLVGYNADPIAVIARVSAMVHEQNAIAVLGNHDEAVVKGNTQSMNDAAAAAVKWTQTRLSPAQIEFLAGLPLTQRDGKMLFVHASAAAPARWPYILDGNQAARSIEAGKASYVFSGHVHDPVLYYLGRDGHPQAFVPVAGIPIPVSHHRSWLAVVGSCGQPRDGNPAARYALMDTAQEMLTFFRVPYDHAAAAQKVRRAGLPEALAARLETGN